MKDPDIAQTLLETLFICSGDKEVIVMKMIPISMISTIKLSKELRLLDRFPVLEMVMEVQLSNRISTYSVETET
jgi:hypothetical protein